MLSTQDVVTGSKVDHRQPQHVSLSGTAAATRALRALAQCENQSCAWGHLSSCDYTEKQRPHPQA